MNNNYPVIEITKYNTIEEATSISDTICKALCSPRIVEINENNNLKISLENLEIDALVIIRKQII